MLSVWDGESPTVVRSVDNTDHIIRIGVRTGARLDLFSSAQGKVFCAFLPREQVPGLTRTLRRSPGIEEELDTIREVGLSLNSPDVNGVRTIAAPVFEGDVDRRHDGDRGDDGDGVHRLPLGDGAGACWRPPAPCRTDSATPAPPRPPSARASQSSASAKSARGGLKMSMLMQGPSVGST